MFLEIRIWKRPRRPGVVFDLCLFSFMILQKKKSLTSEQKLFVKLANISTAFFPAICPPNQFKKKNKAEHQSGGSGCVEFLINPLV